MALSDYVAQYIFELLEKQNGQAEIQRNELAGLIGCVPSQINYVLTSRFTPEHGYIVESKRGGGGYIRITRVTMNSEMTIMHVVNSIGRTLDTATARAMLMNLMERGILSEQTCKLIAAAISDRTFSCVPQENRDILRAAIFKNMLMITLQK